LAQRQRPETIGCVSLIGVDELDADIEPKGIHPGEPLATQPHGMRPFSIVDRWGQRGEVR
jgi:hypothetical protein